MAEPLRPQRRKRFRRDSRWTIVTCPGTHDPTLSRRGGVLSSRPERANRCRQGGIGRWWRRLMLASAGGVGGCGHAVDPNCNRIDFPGAKGQEIADYLGSTAIPYTVTCDDLTVQDGWLATYIVCEH